jgi:hypothetical protein
MYREEETLFHAFSRARNIPDEANTSFVLKEIGKFGLWAYSLLDFMPRQVA